MAIARWLAGRASSCRCMCSPACSGAIFLERLHTAHLAGRLRFSGALAQLNDANPCMPFLMSV